MFLVSLQLTRNLGLLRGEGGGGYQILELLLDLIRGVELTSLDLEDLIFNLTCTISTHLFSIPLHQRLLRRPNVCNVYVAFELRVLARVRECLNLRRTFQRSP